MEKQKLKSKFKKQLLDHVEVFNSSVSTEEGDWVVKGFIDIAKKYLYDIG